MDVKCNRFTPWSKGDTRLRTLSTNCRQLVRKITLDDFKKSSFKSDEFLNNVINVIKKVGIQIETNPEATEEENIQYITSVEQLNKDIINVLTKAIDTRIESEKGKGNSEIAKELTDLKDLVGKESFSQNFYDKSGINDIEKDPSDISEPKITADSKSSKELRKQLKFSQIDRTYYGTVIKAADRRKAILKRDLMRACIIDVNRGTKVINEDQLNSAICSLKNDKLYKIASYLRAQDPNFNGTGIMFNSDLSLNTDYIDTLNAFQNFVDSLIKNGSLERAVLQGWRRSLTNNETGSFYEALNAFVDLMYFDESLDDVFGGIIGFKKNTEGTELDGNKNKYQFKLGTDHKVTSWNIDTTFRDATKNITKYSKLIIESTPLLSYESGSSLNSEVTLTNFTVAIANLFQNVQTMYDKGLTTLPDAIVNFHANPRKYSRIIFSYLLKNQDGVKNLDILKIKTGMSIADLNLLYSIAKYIYDETQYAPSIINIENKYLISRASVDNYTIVDAVNGIIDRIMDSTYIQQTYFSQNGVMETQQAKKYQDRKNSYSLMNKINNDIQLRSKQKLKKINDKYQIWRPDNNWRSAYILLGKTNNFEGFKLSLSASANGIWSPGASTISLNDKILTFKEKDPNSQFVLNSFKIDLTDYNVRNRILKNNPQNIQENFVRQVLEFIDTNLLTDFLTEEGLDKLYLYLSSFGTKDFISDFIPSAFKSLLANALQNKYNQELEKDPNLDYKSYIFKLYPQIRNLKSKELNAYLEEKDKTYQVVGSRISDDWLDKYAQIDTIYVGESQKATTKNLDGDSIGNNRISFLGGNIRYYLEKYKRESNTAANQLFFSGQNSRLIVKHVFNMDAQMRYGIKKPVSKMKSSELFYQSIMLNFWGNFIQDGTNKKARGIQNTILIQPTTYSDKTAYSHYAIATDKYFEVRGKKVTIKQLLKTGDINTIIQIYRDTVGNSYKTTLENVLSDLRQVLGVDDSYDYKKIDELLHTKTEKELTDRAQELGIELSDAHFRKFGKYCKLNDLLVHYATVLYDSDESLKARLEEEKVNFVNELLETGTNFFTAYNNEDPKKGSTIVSKLINTLFSDSSERRMFIGKWVRGNKLIIARAVKIVNGQTISRDISLESKVNLQQGETLEVNPILERYFYMDSFLSTNLRLSLTGSEIGHPDKSEINFTKELIDSKILPTINPEYFKSVNPIKVKDADPNKLFDLSKLDENLVEYEIEPWKEDSSKTKTVLKIYLKGFKNLGSFDLVADTDSKNRIYNGEYLVYFKTGEANSGISYGSTKEQRKILYDAVIKAIPAGAKVSTYGNISKGGIIALNKVGQNMLKVSERVIQDGHGNPITIPVFFKAEASNLFKDLTWLRQKSITDIRLRPIYDKAIHASENNTQLTQLKRNVIIPATLQYEQQGTLNGVPKKMKVAVIKDTEAQVFNFRGEVKDNLEARDGSAYINPFISILENGSLQDQKVGVDKKPIWHSFNARTGTATLLKFATFTITSERMRASLNSDYPLFNLFKQMTNMQWYEDGKWTNSQGIEINLVNIKGFDERHVVGFDKILGGHRLIYETDRIGHYREITGFGRDEKGYYTIEVDSNSFNVQLTDKKIKVYHFFDANSEHIKLEGDDIKVPENTHTINSLFELYQSMGGIYAGEFLVDSQGNRKQFTYNDVASEIVVNFMNNVKSRIGDVMPYDSDNYYQPLKEMMISYAANTTAVKNGAANVNEEEAWKGQTKLKYMTLDSDGLGIQLDSDHDVAEAELTEFTQVIAALEAGGRKHYKVKGIYNALGNLAFSASSIELERVAKLIQAENLELSLEEVKNELYNIIGKTIIDNYRETEGRIDLAGPIFNRIKKTFKLGNIHKDDFLIPFSDNSIYKKAISSFISNFTNKSIKRKYPGTGCVMVPGYGIIQTYKFDGYAHQFQDVLRLAKTANNRGQLLPKFNQTEESIESYNRRLVRTYLGTIQKAKWDEASSVPKHLVEAVDYLFAINPELSRIGTKKEYATYLQSIFPTSKVKDVYWHGTNSDMSNGLPTTKGKGSGAPETGTEMYFNKQPYASLQYISGVNRNIPDIDGFNNWVKLWWELKEALGNGRMESDDWKNEIIGPDTRQQSPNKKGVFDRDSGGTHGKYLSERKARYGYENKSDKEFFEEVFGIKYGQETFNDWINRKREEFQNIWKNREVSSGIIPALLNVSNPISEEGQNTYYEEQRGLFTRASQQGNDAILSNNAKNEFGSDVAIIFDPKSNVHLLGTNQDLEGFRVWKESYSSVEEFMPTDIVDVLVDGKFIGSVDLNDIYTYYKFKSDNREQFLSELFKQDLSGKNITFAINVTKPRNLAPARIKWEYIDNEGNIHKMNIFDVPEVRESFLRRNDPTFNKRQNRKKIQKIFDDLGKGEYKRFKIQNLQNEAAEMVVSNIYSERFNIGDYSISEVLKQGPKFFTRASRPPIRSYVWDLSLTTYSGNNTYITLKAPKVDSKSAEAPKKQEWSNTYVDENGDVYALTKDNQKMFKIGVQKYAEGYYVKDDKIYDSKDNEVDDDTLSINRKTNQVVRYYEYVSKYTFLTATANDQYIKHHLYHINIDNIRKGMTNSSKEDLDAQIAAIVSNLYHFGRYYGIQLNTTLFSNVADHIKHIIQDKKRNGDFILNIPQGLRNHLEQVAHNYLENLDGKLVQIDNKKYGADIKAYLDENAKDVFNSFKESLKYISSRIPAQSLQSFMQMQAVAYTETSSNIVYVSHWQTWLQGSDYKLYIQI